MIRSLANCVLWGLAVAPRDARLMADPEWASGILAEPVCVEFGAVGSHSRGIASSASLFRAVRPDLRDILHSYFVANAGDLESLLLNLYEPRYLFPFDELAAVFVEEIVPTQALWRDQRAAFYSPAMLETSDFRDE